MTTTRPRVLVVEQGPAVLELLKLILARGYEVTTASSGSAALSLIRANSYDVVLTDIWMPSASGFEILRAVRARSSSTAVIVTAAYGDVPFAVAAMMLGAFDYVPRPLDSDEVLLTVARAVAFLREVESCQRSGGLGGPSGRSPYSMHGTA
jgi:DNA-binding NtrC family response regulator